MSAAAGSGSPLPAPREGLLRVQPTARERVQERRRALAFDRTTLVDLGFSAALVALALVGFRTAFFGWGWILAAVGGLLLGLGVAHVVAAFRLPAVAALLGVVVAYFVLGGPLAVRQDLLAGVIPSGTTFGDLARTSVHGWKRLLTLLPPVDAVGELMALPFLVGLVGATTTYLVARRAHAPYAVVLAPLALLALTITLGTLQPASLLAQGVAFGVLAIGWMILRASRTRAPLQNGAGRGVRAGIAAGLLAAAAVVGLVVGPHLPGADGTLRQVARTAVLPPFDVAQFPSPLAGYRKYTEPNDAALFDRELLAVKGAPAGTPVRFATLDSWTGSVWGASNRAQTGTAEAGAAFQQVGERVAPRGEGTPATLQISVPDGGYSDVWLPTVGEVTGVKFNGLRKEQLASRLWLNTDTSSAIVPDRLAPGDSYRMDVLLPPKAPAQLPASLLTSSGSLTEGQELSFLDAKIDAWTRDAEDPWTELTSVAKVMRNDGAYTNGGQKNSQESYYLAGHSQGRLSRFVGATQLAGDDEQYASTLALIGNRFDIPTRVVMGALLPEGGVVKGRDVRAWVEVRASSGVWVPLLPDTFVPNRNQKPNQLQSKTDEQKVGALVPPPAGVNPPSVLQGPDQAQNAVNLKKPPKKLFDPSAWPWWLRALLFYVVLPLLALVALYWVIRGAKAWRRRRHATRGTTTGRIAWAWADLVQSARAFGHVVPKRATRLEQAAALAVLPQADSLAAQANAHIFGPGTPEATEAESYWQATDAARGDLRAHCDFWRRLRSDVDPRPLFTRGPANPDAGRRRTLSAPLTRRATAS
jgi:hypothetical protein